MSAKKGYEIKLDDLVLFFRDKSKSGKKETIVNRLIPHSFYTDKKRLIPTSQVQEWWKETVLSDPSLNEPSSERVRRRHYYVANLARLLPPGVSPKRKPRTLGSGDSKNGPGLSKLSEDDLLVFPPEDPKSCYRVTRNEYKKCRMLHPWDISDLDFMACEEGVVLANVPKVTPQGCTCMLLSLVALRSGALTDKTTKKAYEDKSKHAVNMNDHMLEGYKRKG